MKKTIEIVADICDVCGEQCDYSDPCLACGVEHCYECKKTLGKEYRHSVYVSGSGDGYYCNDCDRKLTISGRDSLHAAYWRIESLRHEKKAWYQDFQRRAEDAEKILRDVQEEQRCT